MPPSGSDDGCFPCADPRRAARTADPSAPGSGRHVNTRSRTAASSNASGSPSRRRHRATTSAAFDGVSSNCGQAARPRSMKRRTASYWRTLSGDDTRSSSGRGNGGTSTTVSPSIPSGSRLVDRILSSGHARSRLSARTAEASARCSQLSRMSSARLVARKSVSVLTGQRAGRIAETKGAGHGLRQEGGIVQLGKLGQTHAIRERPPDVGGRPKSETSLSNSSGTNQREERRGGHRRADLTQLAAPSYETREIPREVFGRDQTGLRHSRRSVGIAGRGGQGSGFGFVCAGRRNEKRSEQPSDHLPER